MTPAQPLRDAVRATIDETSGPADSNGEERLLLDRIRLALKLILAGVAVVFVGELVVYPGRELVNVVQAFNFVVVAVALRFLVDPQRRLFNLAVAFTAYVVTIVSTGAVGLLVDDALTPVVILVGMSVVSAAFVPWGERWQLASVVVIAGTAVWVVVSIVRSHSLFWLQDVGAIAPTLAATVVIARVLRRQREAITDAERERCSREEKLREANRQLEHEINEHRRTEEKLRFALRELDHRVKNTLATVQSVADHTLRASPSMAEFAAAFSGRIQAMGRIHAALSAGRWEGLALSELVELVAGPYRRGKESISVECDGSFVWADAVKVLGMTLHELATNAAKHGALSTDDGRVVVSSRVEAGNMHASRPQDEPQEAAVASAAPCLRIVWRERGGPQIDASHARGFGMRLIEEAVVYELDGRVRLGLSPEGVQCEIDIPLHREPQ